MKEYVYNWKEAKDIGPYDTEEYLNMYHAFEKQYSKRWKDIELLYEEYNELWEEIEYDHENETFDEKEHVELHLNFSLLEKKLEHAIDEIEDFRSFSEVILTTVGKLAQKIKA